MSLYILCENDNLTHILQEAINQTGLELVEKPENAHLVIYDTQKPDLNCPLIEIDTQKPLRMGQFMESIQLWLKMIKKGHNTTEINIGDMILNISDSTLTKKNGNCFVLTEKEVMILYYIHNCAPTPVTRQKLLEGVWNYADGVETHTLETHIYRLRQKIEDDPAKPQILTTTNEGYILNF